MKLRTACVILTCTQSGCMPTVQHGPWVREGASGGMQVGAVVSGKNRGDVPGMTAGIDGSWRTGYIPADSTQTAFATGIQTSLWAVLLASSSPQHLWQVFTVDAYASMPIISDKATAAGVAASYNHVMPYVQIGNKTPVNGGWYTTQALMLIPREDIWLWLPSITKVDADRRPRAAHLTLGAGVGEQRGEALYILSLSVYLELFRRDARVR